MRIVDCLITPLKILNLSIFLLMPIVGMGAELRIARGMPYAEAADLVRKQGGSNITTNVGWIFGGLRQERTNISSRVTPPKWSFWELRDYDAVVLVIDMDGDGKVTDLEHWIRKDFDDMERRIITKESIASITFDTDKKKLSWEKPSDSHMSQAEVVRVAGRAGEAAGYRLADYKEPVVRFDKDDQTWWVFYEKRDAWLGGGFSVRVKDETAATKIFAGR